MLHIYEENNRPTQTSQIQYLSVANSGSLNIGGSTKEALCIILIVFVYYVSLYCINGTISSYHQDSGGTTHFVTDLFTLPHDVYLVIFTCINTYCSWFLLSQIKYLLLQFLNKLSTRESIVELFLY